MFRVVSPVDNSVYVERAFAAHVDVERALDRARVAQRAWRNVPVTERAQLLNRFCDAFEAKRNEIARELTWQMGRPIRYAPNEVRGTLERARHMIEIAPDALGDIDPGEKSGFWRCIRREPLGVVLTIAAWNYPYLIAVNSVVPALMAGNAVVLKHSAQTPLCAERFAQCLQEAGLPEGAFQALHLSHEDTGRAIRDPRVDFVAFTGSVAGGHAVQRAAAERFIGVGLELGGCDPVYVRHDADLAHAIENVVDGAYFNSGQSCCGLQRIYVHERVLSAFVAGFVELTRRYALGDPTEAATTLGPVVRAAAADRIREQVAVSVRAGARPALAEREFPASRAGTAYLAPQVLLDADHSMPVMREEIFGPVAGIMRVRSDEEAIELMNDTRYGLTAAIWTSDAEAAVAIGDRVATGTWFMNRCDYLDPALAALPMIDKAVAACRAAGLACSVFSEVQANPVEANVTRGVEAFRAGGHDGVIAFGGGSALDAGKAIALMVGQTRPIWDFEDRADWYTRVNVAGMAPTIGVPTTSGTGSEVGRAAVITDLRDHTKKIIFHPKMQPALVIADPELTLGLPPHITAAVGMDALSHNLEAYCAPFYHPLADGIALEGMRLVKEWLPVAVASGGNLEARAHMMVASAMGATAFQKGLGAMHSLSHPCSANFNTHHGLTNAVVMPYVLIWNRRAIEPKLARLAAYLELPSPSFDAVVKWIVDLRGRIGIPKTLRELGVQSEHIDALAPQAMQDPSTGGNPLPMTRDTFAALYRNCVEGRLEEAR